MQRTQNVAFEDIYRNLGEFENNIKSNVEQFDERLQLIARSSKPVSSVDQARGSEDEKGTMLSQKRLKVDLGQLEGKVTEQMQAIREELNKKVAIIMKEVQNSVLKKDFEELDQRFRRESKERQKVCEDLKLKIVERSKNL